MLEKEALKEALSKLAPWYQKARLLGTKKGKVWEDVLELWDVSRDVRLSGWGVGSSRPRTPPRI